MTDKHDDEIKVVPLDEVKSNLDEIKSDVSDLREQLAKDREETGLAIEERGDDLAKALNAVDDLTKRMDAVTKAQKENDFNATFGESAGELKDALDSFRTGFGEMVGDDAARWHEEGSKPSIKHLVEGVYQKTSDDPEDDFATFHAPRHKAIRRLQKAADDVYVVDAMMRAQMDEDEKRQYERSGGMRSLGVFKKFERVRDDFVKATSDLIDTGTEVANWLPTQYSSNLYERVKLDLRVAGLFPEITMQAPTMVLPLSLNDKEAMRVTEITDASNADPYADGDFVNPNAISSNAITANAEKLRARFWVSRDAEEDSIVAMLPFLNAQGRRAMVEALEDAIVNGQVSANYDTGGTHFGKTNPLIAAGTDARDVWDGLRYLFSTYTGSPATSVDNSNADPTVTALRSIRAAMGEYGVDPGMLAYIVSPYGYVKLLDDDDVMTVDKFGPQATVRTGVLAQVDGVDVITSRRVPENANASGIIDGSTTDRTLALVTHTEAALLFNRRRITVGTQDHVSSDTRELVWFWRGDFQPVYPAASIPWGGVLYNVSAA